NSPRLGGQSLLDTGPCAVIERGPATAHADSPGNERHEGDHDERRTHATDERGSTPPHGRGRPEGGIVLLRLLSRPPEPFEVGALRTTVALDRSSRGTPQPTDQELDFEREREHE